jgi:hypothetical protein
MDLEELPKWFPSGEIHAVEENGNVLLVGAGLNSLADADAVLKKAQEVLDEFAAVISLLWTSFRKPQIAQVFREDPAGHRSAYIFLTGIAAGRSKVSGVMVDASGIAPTPATTQAQDLLAAARKSKHLQEALKVWADPVRTWGRLYRIVEEVKKHFGKPVDKAGLCTEAELDRFTHTANTAEAAGLDARHASGSFQYPKSPMTLQEATSFVSRLLDSALRK